MTSTLGRFGRKRSAGGVGGIGGQMYWCELCNVQHASQMVVNVHRHGFPEEVIRRAGPGRRAAEFARGICRGADGAWLPSCFPGPRSPMV